MTEQVVEVIRTRQLELVDARGKTRGGLGFNEDCPALVLRDENDTVRAQLQLRPNGNPLLELYNERQVVCVQITLDDHGNPLVTVTDEDRQNHATLGIGGDGGASLAVTKDGEVIARHP